VQTLPIHLLAPGMTLAKPVSSDKGVVLLAQGTELTEALIQRLDRMQVTKVVVEGHPVDLPGQSQRNPQQRLAELDRAFSRVENDPPMMALKAIFVECAKSPPQPDETQRPSQPGDDGPSG